MQRIIFFIFITAQLVFSAVDYNSDSLSVPERTITALPFAYYTGETGLAFGLFLSYGSGPGDMIFTNTVYTLKDQLMLLAIADRKSNDIYWRNTLSIKRYFSVVYGIGNRSKRSEDIKYRYFQADNMFRAGKDILSKSRLYIKLNNFIHIPETSGKYTDSLTVRAYPGSDSQISTGIGFLINRGTVTERFFRDGYKYSVYYLYYPSIIGNIGSFHVFGSENLWHRSLNNSALNIQILTRFSAGKVHPEKLSSIGGSDVLRGYPDRRFLDKSMVSFQAQYDIRIYKNLSASIFAGAGDVFSRPADLAGKNIKTGYGTGLMYGYGNLNLRFDIAYSPESRFNEPHIIILGFRAF